MCGIVGIVQNKSVPINTSQVLAMNQMIRHRGPDDEGYVLIDESAGSHSSFAGRDSPRAIREMYPQLATTPCNRVGNIALGHRRFSIIDLSERGHQPLLDSTRNVVVVFNGEIYNYLELRTELQAKGHVFRSQSDTEVIVEAYKAWGSDCFRRLNGMWAIALYDFRRRILLLSRDRLGKLPLYWTKLDEALYFASEIKALLAVPAIARRMRVNEAAVAPYLAYGLRDLHENTFFEGIYSFPAASFATVNEEFPRNAQTYWKLPDVRLRERDISVPDAADALREILRDAVRIRLRADVPGALELSGGLDSSTLVALASQQRADNSTVYTVQFHDQCLDETPFARSVARRFNVDHRIINVPIRDFWSEILQFTYLLEEPYHSPNLHTNQMVRRQVRADGFKTVIAGAGGDELFAGYGEYFRLMQYEFLTTGRFGMLARNQIPRLLESGISGALPLALARKAARLLNSSLYAIGLQESPHQSSRREGAIQYYPSARLSQRLLSDMTNTKMPYWLRSGDKACMGIPIESRLPMLDYRMVELAFSLPITYLIRDGWHKWILRVAMRDILPPEVVWRKTKLGFPFPSGRFFSENKDIISTILRRSNHPYAKSSLPNNLNNAWRLVSFLLWYEFFFNHNVELFTELANQSRTGHQTECQTDAEFLNTLTSGRSCWFGTDSKYRQAG